MSSPKFGRLLTGMFIILLLASFVTTSAIHSTSPPRQAQQTGTEKPGMSAFDRIIPALMRKYNVPGGAVAVVKEERLVFARGYGWADRETHEPVQPDSLFRIASLSKAITAATVLKLVEAGRLKLNDRAFRLLDDLKPLAGAKINVFMRLRFASY